MQAFGRLIVVDVVHCQLTSANQSRSLVSLLFEMLIQSFFGNFFFFARSFVRTVGWLVVCYYVRFRRIGIHQFLRSLCCCRCLASTHNNKTQHKQKQQ